MSARPGLVDPDGWTLRARCRGAADRVFFPLGTTRTLVEDKHADAKAICAPCPVTAQCLQRAMRTEGSTAADYRHGVFGGLTPDERYELYLQRTSQAEVA